jgi:uncharacterized protein YukE
MAPKVMADRRGTNSRFLGSDEVEGLLQADDESLDPARALEGRVQVEALQAALDELSPRCRDIVMAARIEEISHREITVRFNISTRMVEKELKAALEHCSRRLDSEVIQRFGPRLENRLDVGTASFSMPDDRAQALREAQDWLVRLTSGRATPHDAEQFQSWCAQSAVHAEAFAETLQLWRALRPAAESMARSTGPRAGTDNADTDAWQPRGGWHAAGRRSAYGLSVGGRKRHQ